MALFCITCWDKPGVLDERVKHRPDHVAYLKTQELEVAYAILLAKAEEKRIEKAVNRSKGQPDAPITPDPPSWVKKGKRAQAL